MAGIETRTAAGTLTWRETTVQGRSAAYGTAGDGPPLLFLHGWGLGYRSYRRALQRLVTAGHRVIAPALPGFGGTPALPTRDLHIHGYGTWTRDLLAALDVDEPVTLVGHSFGGGVAITLAHDTPGAVGELVLVNSIGGSAWGRGSFVRTVAERPLWDWGLHFSRDLLPVRQVRRVLPVILEDALPNLLRNPRAFWDVGTVARLADLTAELEALRERQLPIVVLWGRRDRIISETMFLSLCEAAGVRPGDEGCITTSGNHSWLLADPDGFGEVMTNVTAVARRVRGAGPDALAQG
jgi:pimeloyl-ACP methyl ester carboxylesterase